MTVRPRILILHTHVQPHGGASGVLMWTLQTLVEVYDVTLLTWSSFDLLSMNRFFGTTLEPSQIRIMSAHPVIRWAFSLDPDPGSIQKYCYLMRVCKQIRGTFDLVFTTDNEADLGQPALQYVHVPRVAHLYPKLMHTLDCSPMRKLVALWRGHARPWMLVADYSFERMQRNRTIVNSDWTGRWFRRAYGGETTTIYPPAAGEFRDIPWDEREDGFVLIGRLEPIKRQEWCLDVLEKVQQSFPRIHVHIIGSADHSRGDTNYVTTLAQLAARHASWVTLHQGISRAELTNLVSRQKFGMHAMVDEHFGMAVAEMVLAGCIPFVHDSGGQVEIVGNIQRCRWVA